MATGSTRRHLLVSTVAAADSTGYTKRIDHENHSAFLDGARCGVATSCGSEIEFRICLVWFQSLMLTAPATVLRVLSTPGG